MRNWSDAERAAERARMKGGQVLSGWSRVVLLREMRVVSASLKLSPTFRIMCGGERAFGGRESIANCSHPIARYLPNKGSGEPMSRRVVRLANL